MHLILDLDETLVSVSMDPIKDPDFKFTLQGIMYYGKKRPGLDLFLTFAFKRFVSVSVWTAATCEYARKVISNIMTPDQKEKLAFFNTRKDLETMNQVSYYKPLDKIFKANKAKKLGITKANTIMIDDKENVLVDNPGNGILIPAWKGNKKDKYLPKLLIILDGVMHHGIVFGHFPKVLDLRHLVD